MVRLMSCHYKLPNNFLFSRSYKYHIEKHVRFIKYEERIKVVDQLTSQNSKNKVDILELLTTTHIATRKQNSTAGEPGAHQDSSSPASSNNTAQKNKH